MREIDSRRLNVMAFNLPESKKDDIKDRQLEDTGLLHNVMEQKINLNMEVIEVVKPIRVDPRETLNGEIAKIRPLRFSVKV